MSHCIGKGSFQQEERSHVWIPQSPAENKRIVKAFVWSIALYGSESWTLQKSDIRRIETSEMWIWHHTLKIAWTEHKRNDKVLKQEENSWIH